MTRLADRPKVLMPCAIGLMIMSLMVPRAQAHDVETGVDDSRWQFEVSPYFFLAGVSGHTTLGSVGTFPINAKLSELLENLQFGGMLGVEGRKGQWGFSSDFEYISLEGVGGLGVSKLQLNNLIAQAAGTFSPGEVRTLRFYGGVRVYGLEQVFTLDGQPESKNSTTLVDPILGATATWRIHPRWEFSLLGDLGGFGVSSESTYRLEGGFDWMASKAVSLEAGYRVLSYRVNADPIIMDISLSGLTLGLDWRF